MKKITIVWIVLIVLLTFGLTYIGLNVTKRNKPYKELEGDIIEAMKVYYGQDSNLKKLPSKNREVKISLKELEKFGIEINTDINDDKCEGFGIVKGKNVSYTYHAFIKCKKYTTDKYEEY